MFSLPAQAQGRPAWVQDKYFSRIFQIPFFRAKTHASGVHVLRIRNFRAAEDDCRDRTEYAREGANRQNPGVKRPASGSLPQFSIRRGGCRRPKGGERQRSAGCDSWARSSAVLRGSTWIDTSVSGPNSCFSLRSISTVRLWERATLMRPSTRICTSIARTVPMRRVRRLWGSCTPGSEATISRGCGARSAAAAPARAAPPPRRGSDRMRF